MKLLYSYSSSMNFFFFFLFFFSLFLDCDLCFSHVKSYKREEEFRGAVGRI
jgi:hypothetical protein